MPSKTQDVNVNAESVSAEDAVLAAGFTPDWIASHARDAIVGTWSLVAAVAAYIMAGLKRDAVLGRLIAAGVNPDAVSQYIGTGDGAFTQRRQAVAVMRHAGVDLTTAAAFEDAAVRDRLVAVSWRTAFDGRDVVLAAPEGARAWAALEGYRDADAAGRARMTVAARDKAAKAATKAATAAKAALSALPEDAPEDERKAAEDAAKTADKAADKAAKMADKAKRSAANKAGAGTRDSVYAVNFDKAQHDAVVAAFDKYNADKAGPRRTLPEFIVAAVKIAAAHSYR